jgi:hypothetical protein
MAILDERPTEHVDALRQVAILDDRVGPEVFYQEVFFEQVATVLNQQNESVEGFRGQADGFAAAGQYALDGIKAIGSEPEKRSLFLVHCFPQPAIFRL